MDFEVEVDTGLHYGIIKLAITADSEEVAKNKAIQQCLEKYNEEYFQSKKDVARYKQIYRNLRREKWMN